MTHHYNITGMTCRSCVTKVKSEILKTEGVTNAEVQLHSPQAVIKMSSHVPLSVLQSVLQQAGNYNITAAEVIPHEEQEHVGKESWFKIYKPILLIAFYIVTITFLIEVANGFSMERWMSNFMAAFFLIFSLFKLLDLRGFADSYATYDIIAKRWFGWGYFYAFIELALGFAFLLGINPIVVNTTTFLVMGISSIGVLQAVLNKRKIKCACLGTVFNLPMSTITIVEDVLMMVMSLIMILTHIIN